MPRVKHATSSLLVAVGILTLMVGGVAHAQQVCEYPLFIEQNSVLANVIFVFDSSGSMDVPVYHEGYNQFTLYTGNFNSTKNYYVGSDGWYNPQDFTSGWPSSPDAYLVDSDQGEDARYPGNYLNWVYFHATTSQRNAIPAVTRIQVAKGGVSTVINITDGVRFGLWKFNSDSGGTKLQQLTTNKSAVLSSLNGIKGSGWTPLAETLQDVLFDLDAGNSVGSGSPDDDQNGSPIQYDCQKTFIVVVTDGYPTQDLNVNPMLRDYDGDGVDPSDCQTMGAPDGNKANCSDHLDDVAKYLYDTDLRPDENNFPGVQNAITYAIGFGLDANILQDTADNGGGLYFSANNAAELQTSLSEVLRDIISQISSGTAVSVVSAENATDNRLYRAKFDPLSWKGDLEAFDLPYTDGDLPVWKAGPKLQTRTSERKLYTSTTGANKMRYRATKVSNLMPLLGTSDTNEALDMINYFVSGDIAGYRDRDDWQLGDIVNSSPVFVGDPSHFFEFLDYETFRANNIGRRERIYVGSNGGMMHAFATNGNENWAYIPKEMLPRMKDMMDPNYCHEFSVNLTAKVFDAHVNGAWKTLLVSGMREGGDTYFCLDVTDPRPGQFKVMWDKQFPAVGQSWGIPEIVRDATDDEFQLVVPTGPLGDGWSRIMVLDIENGNVLDTYDLNQIGGSQENKATDPIAVDIDFDGYEDILYVAELGGNIYRFDMTQQPWVKSHLFSANKPIQAKPIISLDANYDVTLFFGTGRYIESSDVPTTNQQSFYAVTDNHSGTSTSPPLTPSDLIDQSSTVNQIGPSDRGWFIDLEQAPGERVTRPNALIAGTVYFTSFEPATGVCNAGGRSWLYRMDFEDGSNPDNDDETENDNTDERVEDLGDGIHSEPILDLANEDILLQSTDTTLSIKDTNGNILRVIVRSWRQLFQ